MKIDILTLFPEMFQGPFDSSIIKRAKEKGLVNIKTTNIRDYAHDKHRIVDDYPFGGGAGMLMKPEPVFEAVETAISEFDMGDSQNDGISKETVNRKVILLCPQGRVFNQEIAKDLSTCDHLVFICGHYEGIDERIRESVVNEELSIGDFVLTGGELPTMVIVDALVRMIPGALGEEESFQTDSFFAGLLGYPQYTRPREFRGITVPEVLLSGDHEKIRLWRRKMSLSRTKYRRPDLLTQIELSKEDLKLLKQIEDESERGGSNE